MAFSGAQETEVGADPMWFPNGVWCYSMYTGVIAAAMAQVFASQMAPPQVEAGMRYFASNACHVNNFSAPRRLLFSSRVFGLDVAQPFCIKRKTHASSG